MENNARQKQIAALLSRTLIRKRPVVNESNETAVARVQSRDRNDKERNATTEAKTGGER